MSTRIADALGHCIERQAAGVLRGVEAGFLCRDSAGSTASGQPNYGNSAAAPVQLWPREASHRDGFLTAQAMRRSSPTARSRPSSAGGGEPSQERLSVEGERLDAQAPPTARTLQTATARPASGPRPARLPDSSSGESWATLRKHLSRLSCSLPSAQRRGGGHLGKLRAKRRGDLTRSLDRDSTPGPCDQGTHRRLKLRRCPLRRLRWTLRIPARGGTECRQGHLSTE